MKGFRKYCIVSLAIFIGKVWKITSKNFFFSDLHNQLGFSNHYLHPPKSGQILPWILLKDFLHQWGKNIILVVVDQFSKFAHLIPLAHPYTVVSMACLFFDYVFKSHELPETMVSDRDVTFTSVIWSELFHLCGTQLAFSFAYHP